MGALTMCKFNVKVLLTYRRIVVQRVMFMHLHILFFSTGALEYHDCAKSCLRLSYEMLDANATWFLASAKISFLRKLVDQVCHTSDALEEVKITANCCVGCECVIFELCTWLMNACTEYCVYYL